MCSYASVKVLGTVEQCGEYSPPSIDEIHFLNEHTNVHERNMRIEPSEYIMISLYVSIRVKLKAITL
jgi:hypothetical protein